KSAADLARDFPEIEVIAVCADYTRPFTVPRPRTKPDARRVVFFPGSTIGNFTPRHARESLAPTAQVPGPGGGLLSGVALTKDPKILDAAYHDREGLTAAFNLNLLLRINRELGADFDLSSWRHCAKYDESAGRIEMHLVSQRRQTVHLNGSTFSFA